MDNLATVIFDSWSIQLSPIVALSAVAVVGYLVGRARRERDYRAASASQSDRLALRRARVVARELDKINITVRRDLKRHQLDISRFERRLAAEGNLETAADRKDLYEATQAMLQPTLELAAQLSRACDQVRQNASQLMNFTEVRTDALTGVSNRRALDELLLQHCNLRRRYGQLVSVVVLDVDHFKQVNDQHGHQRGDEVLRQIAKLLDTSVRDTDLVGRYGGEEFVILMPQTDLEGATTLADRLRSEVQQAAGVTISGGVASAHKGESPDDLIKRADEALYSAKHAGRNRIHVHDGLALLDQSKLVSTAEADTTHASTVT